MKPAVIGQRIADSVRVLSDAAVSALYRVEPESGRLVLQACSGEGAATFGWIAAFPPGTSLADLAARSGRPAVTSDLLSDPRVPLSPESRLRIARTEHRALLCVPLVREDTVVGTLAVGDAAGRVLDGEWLRPLQAFAAQAAVALEESGAWEPGRARESQAASPPAETFGPALLQSLDLREVGQRVVDGARDLLGAQRATLVRVEPDSDALAVLAIAGDEAFPLGTGVASFAVRERRPLIAADLLDDGRLTFTPEVRGHLARLPVRAVLSVPLLIGETAIGALSVGDVKGRVFEPHEVRLLQGFADQAAIALHNAGVYDESRRQEQEAEALQEVATDIISSLEQHEVFRRIVAHARRLCGSDLAFLAPYDVKAGTATIVAASGPGHEALTALAVQSGQGAGGWVLETGEPFATDDYRHDPRISRRQPDVPAEIGVLALAVVPLRFRGSITGLLWVANRAPRGFSSRDVRVLTKLAAQAAIALENSRLYAQAQELAVSRERVRVATELHDTLSQMLFSMALGLDWCLHRLGGASELRTKIQEIKRETGLVMRHMRDLIYHLAPDHRGTDAEFDQLARLVRQFRELTGIPVDLVEQGDASGLPARQREVLYKTFQEALANVARHARATRATIRIDARPEEVRFEVTDDGIGLPADADLGRLARAPAHFGLRQMLERIEAIGGSVTFSRTRPSGFRVRGTLPTR